MSAWFAAHFIISILLPFFGSHFVLWKIFGFKMRYLALYTSVFALYLLAESALVYYLGWDAAAVSVSRTFVPLPHIIFSQWLFRKRFWQTLFLQMMNFPYGTLGTGTGLFAANTWFAESPEPLLGAIVVTVVIYAVILPPLLYVSRRLIQNPGMTKMWKVIWLMPLISFALTIVSGKIFLVADVELDGFILVRVITLLFLLLTFYILESTSRQATELVRSNENARRTEAILALQREQYTRQLDTSESIKKMRHDMRHHLAVMRGYNETGDNAALAAYMNEIAGALPAHDKTYCKNFAVNAVAAHYLGAAECYGIEVEADLIIPEDTGSVPAIDLCVIIGNLLENALNAAAKTETRFIRAASHIEGTSLCIMMENSYDGKPRKDTREGIGLSSVKAVCEKHGGIMRVETNGQTWKVFALVETDGE